MTSAVTEKGDVMFEKLEIGRVVVGSGVVVGLGLAGMIGAGTASAKPGISYDGGPGEPIGIGDDSATGAQANASNDNKALAISIFRPATATAVGQNRTGNTVIAIDGTAGFLDQHTNPVPDDHDNVVVAIHGTAAVHGEWNHVFAVGSTISNKPIATYPGGGQDYAYSAGRPLFPNNVIAVCGRRLAGNKDIFDVSGGGPC